MTITVTGSTTIGISLTLAGQNPVLVGTGGTINVSGTNASAIYAGYGVPGTITNDGMITAANGSGIVLLSAGTVTNGGAALTSASIIGGLYGVKLGIHGSGVINNYGTIANTSTTAGMGVFALGSATLTNGSPTDKSAAISGYYSGVRLSGSASSVANFGKIVGTSRFGDGVYLRDGGSVTNGSTADTVASIGGVEFGILIQHAPGTVTNFGTVAGTGTQFARGIVLADGGTVVNGASNDTAAYIVADNKAGVYTGGTIASAVVNFGTIRAIGQISKGNGISMLPGGTVTNGSASDTTATIIGERHGVYIRGDLPSAVVNFGTIQGIGNNGLSLYQGGGVTNGSTADTSARISGVTGIYQGGTGTISNFATIAGTGNAIVLALGGSVINGSTVDKVAQIIGATGVLANNTAATVANYGTILGTNGSAIQLSFGGSVTNGSATDTTAQLIGSTGVSAKNAAATVANFGTVNATGGSAISLSTGGSVTNGSTADTSAFITSTGGGIIVSGAPATVTNFATISGGSVAISLGSGGSVTNGSPTDTKATISGVSISGAAGTLVNFGVINSPSTFSSAVNLSAGGSVTNGSSADMTASISGVSISGAAGTLVNYGVITSPNSFNSAVSLSAGGSVTNGSSADTTASISGVSISGAAGTLMNFGVIKSGNSFASSAALGSGGSVTNGSATDTSASIGGVSIGGAAGTLVNFGIVGTSSFTTGAILSAGGSVTNGSTADTSATIIGGISLSGTAGALVNSVANFGTITGAFQAVALGSGGSVTNGSATDKTALIAGQISISGAAGTVANFGTVGGGTLASGVFLSLGGNVTNGSTADTSALIGSVYEGGLGTISNFGIAGGINLAKGGSVTNGSTTDTIAQIGGVSANNGAATIANYGTIGGTPGSGIALSFGGSVTNGSTADTKALITSSSSGITSSGAPTTVTNFGSIAGSFTGVSLGAGGTVTNGAATDTTASISGGVAFTGAAGTLVNFGTVNGAFNTGAALSAGGNVTNGSTADSTARIIGGTGIVANGVSATVANFGTVSASSTAVVLNNGGSITNGTATDKTASLIGGSNGVSINGAPGNVANFGAISGTSNVGVFLAFGGSVTNGSSADTSASIAGSNDGVQFAIHGNGTLSNYGTIRSTSTTTGVGVFAAGNASVVNGTSGLIAGYYDGVQVRGSAASVVNLGEITASSTFGIGVYLSGGGAVTNGSTANTTASILSSEIAIEASHKTGTVTNFGTIKSTGPFARGIVLADGGSVTNGSTGDTSAYIGTNQRNGVYIAINGTVVNFGTIKGTGPGDRSNGVAIRGSGTVTNGSSADTKALIAGSDHGIYLSGGTAASVANFGTVSGTAKSAISFYAGGNLTNGSTADTTALVSGASGAYLGGPASVMNFGTIIGTAGSAISLRIGGNVVNGSATDTKAVLAVTGTIGVHSAIYDLSGTTTVTNFGTVTSPTSSAIHLQTGGTITNGSTGDTIAVISGASGHSALYVVGGPALVTNFGTITGGTNGMTFTNGTISAAATVVNAGLITNAGGTAGQAISFGTGTNRLVVDPGASFVGKVSGGSGTNTMELASGTGTVGSIGSQFINFGTVVVDSGGSWTLSGTNSTGTVTNNGTVNIAASSTLDATTAVDPASTGLFKLNSSSVLELAADAGSNDQMSFIGGGKLIIDHAASFGTNVGKTTYTGPLIENFSTSGSVDLKDITLAGATLNYTAATGLLQINQGSTPVATLAFQNNSLGAGSFHTANDGSGHLLLTHS